MDRTADRRARIGTGELLEMDDCVPAMRPDPQKAGQGAGADARATAADMRETASLPPPRKHTSILQAERQAKIIVLTSALATWAYFSQDFISVPELILTIKHGAGLGGPAPANILGAQQRPAARR